MKPNNQLVNRVKGTNITASTVERCRKNKENLGQKFWNK